MNHSEGLYFDCFCDLFGSSDRCCLATQRFSESVYGSDYRIVFCRFLVGAEAVLDVLKRDLRPKAEAN